MKKLKGLNGFWYYDLDSDFKLTAEPDRAYFKTEIVNKQVSWNGSKVSELLENAAAPAYDSGVICARSREFPHDKSSLKHLKVFIAPYQLMRATIGEVALKDLKQVSSNVEADVPNELAVGIGMVLSIVAKKGSSKKRNSTPYIMLINRGDVGIRSGELDAAVVEGLNCKDFAFEDGQYKANLDDIVKRALEEERGINCTLLQAEEKLQLPQKYYLGYDEQYHQWNFFGTVIIDCTVEELIRQGCYFTKDKFESKGVVGMPINPYALFSHLSMLDTLEIEREMWNTAWASAIFAVRDFGFKKPTIVEKNCLAIKDRPEGKRDSVRAKVNNAICTFASKNREITVFCLILSILLLPVTVLSFICATLWGIVSGIISALLCLISFAIMFAALKSEEVSKENVIKVSTYWDDELEYDFIDETKVFRNVRLIDGNIAEKERQLFFAHESDGRNPGQIKPQRKCKVFNDDREDPNVWILKDDPRANIEHVLWKIISSTDTENTVRFIAPCIINKNTIVFRRDNHSLAHYIDVAIPYKNFVAKNDFEIKKTFADVVMEQGGNYFKHVDSVKVNFKFLLQAKQETVVVGFVESNVQNGGGEECMLSSHLTNATFEQNMKDDVTRVACEYAFTEYYGYTMR